ncbi:MAG: beta-carotene ketolase [Moorea sp. SIO1G6]|uniref:Fatty acid desaturase n=1 Tax=Moorena producens (strain JHB) TaxID=1454205 RepID=A0A1D9G8M1_MOOP1|nr:MULTISPECIES: fatty acid desaturase [Moorena]AOY84016.1 fatty acid desaturase [Moorena producens JHB]NET63270.1 beta-carotene ketolase [Moorena sp. SIO1G6]
MPHSINITPERTVQEKIQGIAIALSIIGLWTSSLLFLFTWEISQSHPVQILLGIWWQTFLYTGLFITAHEGMHGLLCPHNLQLNHLIGSAAIKLYGLFSYKKLLTEHWLHHRYPASSLDPDFHDGRNGSFWPWYSHFMKNYWSWRRLGSLLAILSLIWSGLHICPLNLFLFVLVPSMLSSLQLFYFGTFLPHREPKGGYRHPHRAQSNQLPLFWSFITCYHFGYHQEHHEHPDIPWWQLPKIYRRREEPGSVS